MLWIRSVNILYVFVTSILMIRYLSVTEFGSYTAATYIYSLLTPLIFFGFGPVITREVAREKKEAWTYYFSCTVLGITFSFFSFLVLRVMFDYIHYPEQVRVLSWILALAFFPSYIVHISESLLIGIEKIKVFAFVNSFFLFFEALLYFLVLLLGYKAYAIAWCMVSFRWFFSIYLFFLVKKEVDVSSLNFNLEFVLKILKVAFVFALIGIETSILFRIGVLFLSKMHGVYETGLFSAAYKVVSMLNIMITSFIVVFFPVATKFYHECPKLFARVCEVLMRLNLCGIFLIILMVLPFTREITVILFKDKYVESGMVLQYLIFLLIPLSMTPLLGITLSAAYLQKYDLVSLTIAMVISFFLNYFLIKFFACYGCVFAMIGSFAIIQICQTTLIYLKVFKLCLLKNILMPFFIFGFVLTIFNNDSLWSGFEKWFLSVSLYCLCIYIFRILRKDDFYFLKKTVIPQKEIPVDLLNKSGGIC